MTYLWILQVEVVTYMHLIYVAKELSALFNIKISFSLWVDCSRSGDNEKIYLSAYEGIYAWEDNQICCYILIPGLKGHIVKML
jgi:hypothetical protein